jgi:phospholipase/carboxylesterase
MDPATRKPSWQQTPTPEDWPAMRAVTPIDEGAVVWSHPEGERDGRPLVLFLHGYGGRESDWAAWFTHLRPGTVGASVSAPARAADGWAWADFDQPGMTHSRVLRELSATARGVRTWVERLPVGRIALVGWSQGGALAVHLLRQQPDRFVSAAVVAGFVADTRPHAGVRARRPPVWYGMGGRDDVIPAAMAERSRRWLSEHTTATLVDLPDEDHMLSPTFVGPALAFTAAALDRAG